MSSDITPIREALDNPTPAPTMAQPGDARAERRGKERPPFPPDCPVTPLGIKSSIDGKQTCYYLDVNKQLVGLEANNKHGKNGMVALFGGEAWLEEHFPRWSKPTKDRPAEIVGWDQAEATAALIGQCVASGIFSAVGKIRGRGAHQYDNGGLALHCGDTVLVSNHNLDGRIKSWRFVPCGEYGGFVYPGDVAIPRPWHEPVGVDAAQLLIAGTIGRDGLPGLLRTWNWKRPLLDPRLLLGWIGGALIGGALEWRPNMWLTGGRGTGKTGINGKKKVLHQLLGDGMFRTGNASAAAIRQSLMNATVPVLFDELEAKVDNRRVSEVLELARVASSGDSQHRGGADHNATEFTLQSAFLFSSINIPPLEPQDRSRLAILELQPFPKDWPPEPEIERYNLPVLGRKLLRRMVDQWARLAEVKAKYVSVMRSQGHDGRACEQFGTLLACAHVLLSDDLDEEEVIHWADMCRPEKLREIAQEEPDWARCLHHLLGGQVQARGGDERVALASWVGDAVDFAMAPLLGGVDDRAGDERAAGRLANLGIKLVNVKYEPDRIDGAGNVASLARWGTEAFDPAKPGYLALAASEQSLAKLLEGTLWAPIYGDVLSRCPGALECRKVRFGKRGLKAVMIPLHHVLDEDQLPEMSQAKAAKAWLEEECGGEAGA